MQAVVIDFDEDYEPEERAPDPRQEEAESELEEFFGSNREARSICFGIEHTGISVGMRRVWLI